MTQSLRHFRWCVTFLLGDLVFLVFLRFYHLIFVFPHVPPLKATADLSQLRLPFLNEEE